MLKQKHLLLFLMLCLFSLVLMGCPTPEAYVKSSELALKNSENLDKNIDIFAKNYYTFIQKDIDKIVKEGKMTDEQGEKAKSTVAEQMANLKSQSVINRKFVILAHDQAHDDSLDLNDVLLAIQTVNKAYPEVKDFIDKIKGDK